jgi:hypothetical protein
MYLYRRAKEFPQFSLSEWGNYGTRDENVYIYVLYNQKYVSGKGRGRFDHSKNIC